MELRLDTAYIVQDHGRLSQWLNHEKENRKPWRVADLIYNLSKSEAERNSEKAVYRFFSMIKHCNPKGGSASFPLYFQNRWLMLSTDSDNSDVLASCLFGTGCEARTLAKIAAQHFTERGFNVQTMLTLLENLSTKLTKLNANHVRSMLLTYMEDETHESTEHG